MKKNVFNIFLYVLLFLSAGHLQAQQPANVKGTWNMSVESSVGSGSPSFELKHITDSTVAGTYQGQLGEAQVKGTLKGNKIYLSFEVSSNLIEYDGVVDGDTMKGKVKLGSLGEGSFTGTRKKA